MTSHDEDHDFFKSSTTRLFIQQLVQANYTNNIISPHNWPFVRGIWWFPSQRAGNDEGVCMSLCHRITDVTEIDILNKHPCNYISYLLAYLYNQYVLISSDKSKYVTLSQLLTEDKQCSIVYHMSFNSLWPCSIVDLRQHPLTRLPSGNIEKIIF